MLTPVVESVRANRFSLNLLLKGKASKAIYSSVPSGHISQGVGKSFINMVLDSLAYDKGRSTVDYNNYMTYARVMYD